MGIDKDEVGPPLIESGVTVAEIARRCNAVGVTLDEVVVECDGESVRLDWSGEKAVDYDAGLPESDEEEW